MSNPHALELLEDIGSHYPLSVHTVGVSIGSAHGVDRHHLARVRALVDQLDPVLVSGHLAWSTHPGEYLNDLLPLPYDDETLAVLATHVNEVQDALGRPFLVENPSSYVGYGSSTMTEPEFLTALVDRTGCQLLCDVSNVYVSSRNMGFDPWRYLDAFPANAVRELHLGGFEAEDDVATPGGTRARRYARGSRQRGRVGAVRLRGDEVRRGSRRSSSGTTTCPRSRRCSTKPRARTTWPPRPRGA